MFTDHFPCQAGDIKTIDYVTVSQLAMQYAVCFVLINVWKTLYEIRRMDIFKYQLIVTVVSSQLFDLGAA